MPQLIAIHEIHCDDANGKSQVIAPGKSFSASDDLAKELLGLNAARVDESVAADSGEGDSDLNKLTKAQLLALAEERQVAVEPTANKAAIIAALEAADDLV